MTNRANTAAAPPPGDEELYTAEEAAARLRVSRTTIYDFLKTGKLTRLNMRNVRIPVASVEAFIRAAMPPEPPAPDVPAGPPPSLATIGQGSRWGRKR